MLNFIVFIIVWPIFWIVSGSLINTFRYRNGAQIGVGDDVTYFLQAMVFPPFSILGAFSPMAREKGQTRGMLIGGLFGTGLAYIAYGEIFLS